jgi:glycosyltransferase involved in cell wall biosynthesis
LVIREAHIAGRPVIASAIGGMAEKTDPSVDILVAPGDPEALAEVLRNIADGNVAPEFGRAQRLAKARLGDEGILYDRHLAVYRSLMRDKHPAR